ncbi:MAG: peptidoglycan DD-metalloendopeptidase family protein, partial [Gammaproteobacteria bacterium]
MVQESGPISEYDAKWPVKGGTLGQGYAEFGSVHRDKYDVGVDYHVGVDIAALEGTPIYAVAEGIVADIKETDRSDNNCMGRVVIIDHGENFTGRGRYALYAHLKKISDALPGPGERVNLGGEIGTVGRSGFDESSRGTCRSPAGSHLHLEIKDKSVLENPRGGHACKYGGDTGPYWGYTPNYPDDYGY